MAGRCCYYHFNLFSLRGQPLGWGRGWGGSQCTPAQVRAIRLGMCVGVGVRACMCVWARARKPVNTCVCVCAASVRERMRARAGDSISAGCLCFSVRQFHFVLYV